MLGIFIRIYDKSHTFLVEVSAYHGHEVLVGKLGALCHVGKHRGAFEVFLYKDEE